MKKALAVILLIVPLCVALAVPMQALAIDTTTTTSNSEDKTSYIVTFDGIPQSVMEGETAVPPTPKPKDGYVFDGWSQDYTNITSDLDITSVWKKAQFKLSFDTNGGNSIGSTLVPYETKADKLPTPKRSSYTFRGWYTDKATTIKFVAVTKDQTVYAKWAKNPTITFKDNGKTLKSQLVGYSINISSTNYTPTKSGYKFSGWYSDSALTKKFDFTKGTTKDITLHAKWTKASYSIEQLTTKYINSCVLITVYDKGGKGIASGSGFMVSYNGKIMVVTNYHVIEGANSAKLELENGKVYSVDKVYAYDKANDLAILTYKGTISGAKGIPLGSAESVKIGSNCVAIGSPKGFKNTVSTGLISQKRLLSGTKVLQTNAPIDHGSSGGVLLNMQGEAIGITSSGFESSANLNCAIYIEYIKTMLKKPKNITLSSLFKTNPQDLYVIKGTLIPYPYEGDYDYEEDGIYAYFSMDLKRYEKLLTTHGFVFYKKSISSAGNEMYSYVNQDENYVVIIMITPSAVLIAGTEY